MVSFTDEDLNQILLVNLRNAAATFGETSAHFQELRAMVEEHLQQSNGRFSPMPDANASNKSATPITNDPQAKPMQSESGSPGGRTISNLVYRPKPKLSS
ncbi:MAG: hypothetical protein M1820_008187 [Bogoriella megaspora]|nr:MAG: hypothetical protein M1820_008187 [Bogoriella megaspora]